MEAPVAVPFPCFPFVAVPQHISQIYIQFLVIFSMTDLNI